MQEQLSKQIKQEAKKYLGRGYDKVKKTYHGMNMLCDPVQDENISVQHIGADYQVHADVDTDTYLKEFESQWGVKLDLFGIPLGFHKSTKETSINKIQTSYHIVSKTCIISARLLKRPIFRDKNQEDSIGDGYIDACSFVIGYQFIIHTSKKDLEKTQNKNYSLEGILSKLKIALNVDYNNYKIESTVKEKIVSKIEIKGIGGYVPKTAVLESMELENLSNLITKLDSDFSEQQSKVQWLFGVRKEDILSYPRKLNPIDPFVADAMAAPLIPLDVSINLPPLTEIELNHLSHNIENNTPEKFKAFMKYFNANGEPVKIIFEKMLKYFQANISLTHIPKKRPILIIGRTGAGKSTLIAYLQKVPLKKSKILGKKRIQVEEGFKANFKYPEISHKSNEPGTRAPGFYELDNYLITDCPGDNSVAGKEDDIINNMCLQILNVASSGIAAVVVTIPIDDLIERGNARQLEELSYRLSRIFTDPIKAAKEKSIIFVISKASENDRNEVLNLLEDYRKLLIKELTPSWTSYIRTFLGRGDKEKSGLAARLQLIEALYYNFNEVIFANPLDDNINSGLSREMIMAALGETRNIPLREISFHNQSGEIELFTYFILAIMSYAVSSYSKKTDLHKKITEHNHIISKYSKEPEESQTQDEKDLQRKRDDLKIKQYHIKKLTDDLEQLEKVDNKLLKEYTTWKDVSRRGFWDWGLWYDGETYKKDCGSKNGTYTKDPILGYVENAKFNESVFSACFIPKWYGYSESSPNIVISIPAHEHPTTLLAVSQIREELGEKSDAAKAKMATGLRKDEEELLADIATLQNRITESKDTQKKQRHAALNTAKEELPKLQKKLQQMDEFFAQCNSIYHKIYNILLLPGVRHADVLFRSEDLKSDTVSKFLTIFEVKPNLPLTVEPKRPIVVPASQFGSPIHTKSKLIGDYNNATHSANAAATSLPNPK